VISVRNISKHYQEHIAVDKLSFDVKEGEIFGIVGPDGAGKSTLLRMMASIVSPNEGSIEINGKSIFKNTAETKENLAYMPQRFGLYEDLKVEENIYFFGKLFGLSNKEILKRLPRLYQFSHLEPFKDRLAGKLSGGMKQKLGLACALVHSPGLILLDEPTNGVDPVSRREFWKILYDLLSDGVTIVVSTAYLDEAERCNRVALMYRGSFITLGSPDEIKGSVARKLLEIITDKPREAEKVLRRQKDYQSVILTGLMLRLFVEKKADMEHDIKRILKEENIRVTEIREKKPTLEDCFVDIIAQGGVK
jgi:ABC-2 type transport system ATP-binding protein